MRGDVLRVTVWGVRRLNPHIWAVQTDDIDAVPGVDYLTPTPKRTHSYDGKPVEVLSSTEGDEWDIVPCKKWPDKICALMAKYRLNEGSD